MKVVKGWLKTKLKTTISTKQFWKTQNKIEKVMKGEPK